MDDASPKGGAEGYRDRCDDAQDDRCWKCRSANELVLIKAPPLFVILRSGATKDLNRAATAGEYGAPAKPEGLCGERNTGRND